MSPSKPGDPQQGKVDEPTPDEATQAKAAAAEASAAEGGSRGERSETGPKPKRAPRAKKAAGADEGGEPTPTAEAADETAAPSEAADETAAPSEAAAVEAAASAEAAESKPAAPKKKPATRKRSAAEEKPAKPETSRRRGARRAAEPGVLVRAQAKYVRTSARKARLVCDHIRGKDVAEARAILAFTPRAAAKAWSKLLESAIANAENNHELVGEELRIHSVVADEGPTLKRFRPRAMGRATRIRKRTSHLTITLTPKES
jgi:ribosomal protein L22